MRKILSLFLFVWVLCSSTISTIFAQETTSRITKNDFKVTLLSLGSGSSRFTYERAFSPKFGGELTVGVIGWGWDFLHHVPSKGMLYKAAFKWNVIPQPKANSWLAGFYLKPEVMLAMFNYADQIETLKAKDVQDYPYHTTQLALLAECGYQLVLKWFVFDVYAGMGPSFGSGNKNNYYHGFINLPKTWPLAFTSGFRIGVAF